MSAAAESNGITNGTVIELVRREFVTADTNGRDRPGRPALVSLAKTEISPLVTEHQVRQAMDQARAEATTPSPACASEPPANEPDTNTDIHQSAPPQAAGGDPVPAAASPTPPAPALVTPAHQATTSRWSWLVKLRHQRWALILMGIGAGFSVWSGWVGLGEMCGYGPVRPLPGIWDGLTVNSAIVLPLSVEAYGTYALRIWLTHTTRSKAARVYACVSAFASLAVGGAAQVAYHELTAYGYVKPPWQVVMSVALVPVVVLALASILAYLARTVRQGGGQA